MDGRAGVDIAPAHGVDNIAMAISLAASTRGLSLIIRLQHQSNVQFDRRIISNHDPVAPAAKHPSGKAFPEKILLP